MALKCKDTSLLQKPLEEVCTDIDISCVTPTSGEPSWTPNPDQLPLAFDEANETIWVYVCDEGWSAYKKFSLCDLSEVSLTNINNVCSVLNIPAYYNDSDSCIQGSVTLQDLADYIAKCFECPAVEFELLSDTRLKITRTDNNGECEIVTYVEVENLTISGEGTEASPIKITAEDPICKWDKLSKSDVDAADDVMLGACVDGEAALIPYPTICALDLLTNSELAEADSITLGACVDGEDVRVPYPQGVCSYEIINATELEEAVTKLLAACVDGEERLIPYPDIPDGSMTCVDIVEGEPSYTPDAENKKATAALDCDGCIWFYTCTNGWIKTCGGLPQLEDLDPSQVDDICENLTFIARYMEGDCEMAKDMTLNQLANEVVACLCADAGEVTNQDLSELRVLACNDNYESGSDDSPSVIKIDICQLLSGITEEDEEVIGTGVNVVYIDDEGNCKQGPVGGECCDTVDYVAQGVGGGGCITLSSTDASIIQLRDETVLEGSATVDVGNGINRLSMMFTNNFDEDALLIVDYKCSLGCQNDTTGIVFMASETLEEDLPVYTTGSDLTNSSSTCALTAGNADNVAFGTTSITPSYMLSTGGGMTFRKVLSAGESVTVHAQGWLVIHEDDYVHCAIMADAIILRGVR